MKAIKTTYKGPTDFKGSRIVASEPDGKRITISYEHALDSISNHHAAAEALRNKLGWNNKLAGGWLGGASYVWVFLPERSE